jgi:hypothetical protein
VPFEREHLGDNYRFRMTADVANMIVALTAEGDGESSLTD